MNCGGVPVILSNDVEHGRMQKMPSLGPRRTGRAYWHSENLFLTLTRTFKVYDLNLSLTAGGPYDSTKLAAMHIYAKAFEEQKYGAGQAEALIMFAVMAAIALTQTYIGKKREQEM